MLLYPNWPAPKGVCCAFSTRAGGVSNAPFNRMNLALHVGDKAEHVAHNRQLLLETCSGLKAIQWLEQVHGSQCVAASVEGKAVRADASSTQQLGLACAVMTADCLPVLFCNRAGTQVAAAHAGWRGLADGVLAQTLLSFQADTASADDIIAYIGPAIGPSAFKVGLEVLEYFFASARNEAHLHSIGCAFRPSSKPLYFYADLYALARAELQSLGLSHIYGGDYCTYSDSRFYSYRRDAITGRMASLIWLK